ncbi:hypothetical protein IWT30_00171 [Secundilactobacillus mixtipabuli]|uniref:Fido domain-containing protein n=2 Tax=Secundilactobacillus mixtipabuli TaxID=1435342 RepID=A0A1Z5I9C5_9LACO|nr:hypothetical protein IWT30_00171 [Secundilactobacillus mixtipabuli]
MTFSQVIQSDLTVLKKKMDSYKSLSKKQDEILEAQIRYEHVWSSNAIEGNTLKRYETTSILQTGLTSQGTPIKDVLETLDLNDAYNYMMDLVSRKQPLTQQVIRDLNRFVTAKTAKDLSAAARYRAILVWPNGLQNHPYVEPFEIQPAMDDLITWSRTAQKQLHPVQYAADLHQRFVSIHPFEDGNGRTARLLMNMALPQAGYPIVNIQPNAKERTAYMNALETSRISHDASQFENIIANYSVEALNNRIKTLALNEQNIKDADQDFDL